MLSTRGVILRSTKYGETSIICDILTAAVGMQSYIISGVRKKNAKHAASLFQPMYLINMEAYDNPRKELNRIKEIRAEWMYRDLPFNVIKSSIGIFALEVLRKSIKVREENVELFEFVHSFFVQLDKVDHNYSNYHIWFILHLMEYIGCMPAGHCDEETPYLDVQNGKYVGLRTNNLQLDQWSSTQIFQLLHLSLESSHQVKMDSTYRNKLIEDILKFYNYHIDGMGAIKSHHVLSQLFT